jgi:hypothetical protein
MSWPTRLHPFERVKGKNRKIQGGEDATGNTEISGPWCLIAGPCLFIRYTRLRTLPRVFCIHSLSKLHCGERSPLLFHQVESH